MTSELSTFAARLREFIAERDRSPVAAGQLADGDANFQSASLVERAADGDRPRSEKEFNALALELFALQFAQNPPYRKICEARRVTPLTVNHWTQIPAVPTAAFKELELSCLPVAERTAVFHSSGTTEQRPSRHFHNAESLAVYEASLWPWFRENLRFAIGDLRLVCLTPPPAQSPHSSLVYMFDFIRQQLGAGASAFVGRVGQGGVWELSCEAAVKQVQGAGESGQPLLLLGTAFSFVHLLDFLGEQNLRFQLPPDSRVVETGGYKGRSRTLPKAELHALITERLGVPASHIICEYGMSEMSSQAYDVPLPLPARNEWGEGELRNTTSSPRPSPPLGEERENRAPLPDASRSFRFPPWVRVQIVSPETGREVAEGKTGLIRVFDLANVFSALAIQTEDLAVRRGDGFELLGRAVLSEPRGCSLMAV